MKKGIKLLFFLAVVMCVGLLLVSKSEVEVSSRAAIVMDAENGEVIFEKNAERTYPVASISKLMTELVILDILANGALKWDEKVIISERANNIIASAVKLPVEAGEELSLEDLFTAMIVSSANNATIALAEHIAGTEDAFTIMMNEKATEIGLSKQTKFVNSTGLPNPFLDNAENEMSTLDVAKLSKVLIDRHGAVALEKANLQVYHLTTNGLEVHTTNRLLASERIDGLKTGYTEAAGYSLVGTSSNIDNRVISVVLGATSDDIRFAESEELLAFGLDNNQPFSIRNIVHKLQTNIKKWSKKIW